MLEVGSRRTTGKAGVMEGIGTRAVHGDLRTR